ncbi:MAG: DNA methylase [Eubacterium sp.]|nr:DNA methylase [Eubacterium sp.]
MDKQYICIDLKSFYASVECVDRGLNPLNTNLVVADPTRTEKTICLAVTPSLKAFGIPGRPRLFEVVQRVKEINQLRLGELKTLRAFGKEKSISGTDDKKQNADGFREKSYLADEIAADPYLELDYIVAPPQMKRYMKVSNEIVSIYLKYIAPEDIHIYSIDEVFMDVSAYLGNYHMSARELAMKMVKEVLFNTGITATAGIGTNMFLAKVAMDVVAKKMQADADGVRIAELDEISYREQLWDHLPITDIWRVGRGYKKRLSEYGMHTMGDVARCSINNEDILYQLFGVNAELLIDHAWGYEPTEIRHIRQYRPQTNSVGSGQVLKEPYVYEKGELIVREMTELLVLDLVKKRLVTDQMVLTINYDRQSLEDPAIASGYHGEITTDYYGRKVPKHAHGTANLDHYTSSTRLIMDAVTGLYEKIVDPKLLIRRVNITACRVIYEDEIPEIKEEPKQLTLFDSIGELTGIVPDGMDFEMSGINKQDAKDTDRKKHEEQFEAEMKERRLQHAILDIQKKFGKNALLKGMNLEDGATTIERNGQVGGHKG